MPRGHHHALPLAHIQHRQGQVLPLNRLGSEQRGQAQGHHAGAHRHNRALSRHRRQQIQQKNAIDKQGPQGVVPPVQVHRGQAQPAGLGRAAQEKADGKSHQRRQALPQREHHRPHRHGQCPAHKGQGNRPAGHEIGQGGDEGKPPKIPRRQRHGKHHGPQTDRGHPEKGGGPPPGPFGDLCQPGLAPPLSKEQNAQGGQEGELQTRVGRRIRVGRQKHQQCRAQAGEAVVVPPQLLGQQGHGTEDGGPHRPRAVARHQAEEHQDQQKKPQLSLFLWVQKQRQKPHQKGHMKARNHHHMPQPYAVEVVPVGLLQAGLIPCEKGMEKPSLPGGIQLVQHGPDLPGQNGQGISD